MTAISNNDIKRLRSLQQKKFRDETGLFIVEGEKMVEEALGSSFEVVDTYRKSVIGEDMIIFRKVIFPSTSNNIISAMKINVSMSLIGVIM